MHLYSYIFHINSNTCLYIHVYLYENLKCKYLKNLNLWLTILNIECNSLFSSTCLCYLFQFIFDAAQIRNY